VAKSLLGIDQLQSAAQTDFSNLLEPSFHPPPPLHVGWRPSLLGWIQSLWSLMQRQQFVQMLA